MEFYSRFFSWNSYPLVTVGKTAHSLFYSPGSRVLQVDVNFLLRRKSGDGCSLVNLYIHCSGFKLISYFYSADGLKMAINWWHWRRLHIHCSGLLGDRVSSSSWYNSFTQKMVLKWLFVSDTWDDFTFIVQVFQETELFSMIILHGRLSWNGHLSVTLGKTLHIYCSYLPGHKPP